MILSRSSLHNLIAPVLAGALGIALLTAPANALAPGSMAGSISTAPPIVRDPFNGMVGTIVSKDEDYVLLRTDRFLIKLPATSFTPTPEGYMIAMSRNEVNAAAHQTLEAVADLVTVGAQVRDRDGAPLGKVAAVNKGLVTLDLGTGSVRIARSAISFDGTGLAVGLSAAEISKAAATGTR